MSDSKAVKAKAKMTAMQDALVDLKLPETMRKYGEIVVEMIKLRTRLGDGVAKEGDKKLPLKELKDSTIADRQRLQAKGKLSSRTAPGKSNLTRTGQLLDSEKVKEVSNGHVVIGPTGVRHDGRKEELTNAEVAAYVTKAGRAYNHLSRTETKRLNDAIKRDLRQALKNRLTKLK